MGWWIERDFCVVVRSVFPLVSAGHLFLNFYFYLKRYNCPWKKTHNKSVNLPQYSRGIAECISNSSNHAHLKEVFQLRLKRKISHSLLFTGTHNLHHPELNSICGSLNLFTRCPSLYCEEGFFEKKRNG